MKTAKEMAVLSAEINKAYLDIDRNEELKTILALVEDKVREANGGVCGVSLENPRFENPLTEKHLHDPGYSVNVHNEDYERGAPRRVNIGWKP